MPLLLALLFLLLFVSTSSGLASVSAVQEQLREIQLKIIGEKLRIIQQSVLGISTAPPPPPPPAPPPEKQMSAAELMATLQEQVRVLESVIVTLKPRAMEEETERLDKAIADLQGKVTFAGVDELPGLQEQLNALISQQGVLEQEIRKALAESIKYRQVLLIKDQIARLQEKVATLPRPAPVPPTAAKAGPSQEQLTALQESINTLRLKLLQAQVKAIQERVAGLAR